MRSVAVHSVVLDAEQAATAPCLPANFRMLPPYATPRCTLPPEPPLTTAHHPSPPLATPRQVRKEHAVLHELLIEDTIASVPLLYTP